MRDFAILLNGKCYNKYYLYKSYFFCNKSHVFDGVLTSGFRLEILWVPVFLSGIYAGLTVLGVTIAALIEFTFRKEVKK